MKKIILGLVLLLVAQNVQAKDCETLKFFGRANWRKFN